MQARDETVHHRLCRKLEVRDPREDTRIEETQRAGGGGYRHLGDLRFRRRDGRDKLADQVVGGDLVGLGVEIEQIAGDASLARPDAGCPPPKR